MAEGDVRLVGLTPGDLRRITALQYASHVRKEEDNGKIVEAAEAFHAFLVADDTPDPLADALDRLLGALKAGGWYGWRGLIDFGSLQISGSAVGLGDIEEGSPEAKALACVDALIELADQVLAANPDHEPF